MPDPTNDLRNDALRLTPAQAAWVAEMKALLRRQPRNLFLDVDTSDDRDHRGTLSFAVKISVGCYQHMDEIKVRIV